ncbi:Mov34/MPN/PAD-1 family protein [Alkalinema pantanalense CENA528]|uniref:Mov34/MPN/PAD-1 family protein n=1 Tax=Alkalinema pantanalense TaxID=1620705 RepID=UPI003D6EBC28
MKPKASLEFISSDNKFGLKVEKKEVSKILKICRSAGKKEVGGILVGTYDETHQFALVKDISGAPSDSKQSRSSFYRGIQGLQNLLNKFWAKQQYFYLGEWHFHPYASSDASLCDIEQMKAIAVSENYNCPEPILIICGGKVDEEWDMAAYVFPRNQEWIKLDGV